MRRAALAAVILCGVLCAALPLAGEHALQAPSLFARAQERRGASLLDLYALAACHSELAPQPCSSGTLALTVAVNLVQLAAFLVVAGLGLRASCPSPRERAIAALVAFAAVGASLLAIEAALHARFGIDGWLLTLGGLLAANVLLGRWLIRKDREPAATAIAFAWIALVFAFGAAPGVVSLPLRMLPIQGSTVLTLLLAPVAALLAAIAPWMAYVGFFLTPRR